MDLGYWNQEFESSILCGGFFASLWLTSISATTYPEKSNILPTSRSSVSVHFNSFIIEAIFHVYSQSQTGTNAGGLWPTSIGHAIPNTEGSFCPYVTLAFMV